MHTYSTIIIYKYYINKHCFVITSTQWMYEHLTPSFPSYRLCRPLLTIIKWTTFFTLSFPSYQLMPAPFYNYKINNFFQTVFLLLPAPADPFLHIENENIHTSNIITQIHHTISFTLCHLLLAQSTHSHTSLVCVCVII